MQKQILIIEDEMIARNNLEHILIKEGYKVTAVESGIKGLALIKSKPFDLIITDYKMKKMDGMQILEHSRQLQPYTEVIMITGYATVDNAVTAMKEGAYHYIAKPYKIEEVRQVIKEALLKRSLQLENISLKQAIGKGPKLPQIIGNSPAMTEVKKTIRQVAQTDISVLILGESGTGKELVARAIHNLSSRHSHEMVAFNCGSFSEELMANELFGHEKEAFTGAVKTKKGLFEFADKGTVFFDEIGDMPPSMQIKILRVIQEKELMRVGSTQTVPVDLRFIAATHRDLKHEVDNGNFRQDLYFRLNVVTIQLPPLAERKEDIPLLAYHFLGKKNREMNKSVKEIDRAAMDFLVNYSWPGNVRELENIIERAVAMENSEVIYPAALPDQMTQLAIETYRTAPEGKIPTMKEQEKRYIRWVLEQTGWNKTKAAEIMEIDRVSLWRKIKTFKLE
ncbi:MAG: sigma-54-dependent Fis family transcriptional regulator [Desulfobacter sp.]|nr:MAG: sigma-54-dependent Fis family transcriptional regulator [Desulfobacter sp.]